jgi:hypothetical protein
MGTLACGIWGKGKGILELLPSTIENGSIEFHACVCKPTTSQLENTCTSLVVLPIYQGRR